MMENNQAIIIGLAGCVLLIPLLSFIATLFIQEKFSWLTPLLSSTLLLLSFICSILLFLNLTSDTFTQSWLWFSTGNLFAQVSISIDPVSLPMLIVVTLISFLVHLYSMGYMAEDHAQRRYFGMLGFFTFSMIGFVISNNLLLTFLFWELVGFSSYRLIGHYQDEKFAAKAATKAFLINRVADACMLLGILLLWSEHRNINFDMLQNSSQASEHTLIGILLFIGVIGKSAQFPFLNWLPDAMAGPTPVSALIHAATMVAAGVFLLVKVYFLFTPAALNTIVIVGAITSLIGALGALFQYDIKKILAYSTISQLGLMVMAIGAGAVQGGFMHLLNHAFFKAGLFLGAGSIIHALHQTYHHHEHADVQDIRNMGSLRNKMPVTFYTFIICSIALAGIPFTTGFTSKEIILNEVMIWMNGLTWKGSIFAISLVVTFLTPMYCFRMIWFVFLSKGKSNLEVTEVPVIMQLPMIVLAAFSLTIIGWGSLIDLLVSNLNYSINHITTITSLTVIGSSIFIAYKRFSGKSLAEGNVKFSPQNALDAAAFLITNGVMNLSSITKWIDRLIIDRLIHGFTYLQISIAHLAGWSDRWIIDGTVNGIAYTFRIVGNVTRSAVNGKIQQYFIWAMTGLLIFILWILF